MKEIVRFNQSSRNSTHDSQNSGVPTVFVSLAQIHKCLEDNNREFQDGFTCVTTVCTNCNEKKEGLLYINKTTGFFVCVDCHDSGDWRNVEPRIRKPAVNTEVISEIKIAALSQIHKHLIPNYSAKWDELCAQYKKIDALSSEEISEILSSFKLRTHADSSALKDLNAIYDADQKNLYFPLYFGKKRIVGIKQLSVDGNEVSEPFKHCYGIMKYIPSKVTQKCHDVIVVSSVKDLIALASRKLSYHVICTPYGINSLPQEILPLLEQYGKIILWFGNQPSGLAAIRLFSKKLHESRCLMIKATDKSPAEYVEGNNGANISTALKSAEPILHESIATFSSIRQEVGPRLTNPDTVQCIKWSRFPILNNLLKGHRRGELTIFTGPTGSGKTTLVSEYSVDLAMQGVSTLWGSFEISNQRLASTMLQQFSLQQFDNDMEKFNQYADQFEKLPIYFLKFYGQQSVQVVMNVVNHAFYVYDIQHLVIDNLQFMMGLSLQEERFMDRFYKQDQIIAAFRTFATQCNCHVTLIIHPRKEKDNDALNISSIFGSAKATQEADNILTIQRKNARSTKVEKFLQILKNRYSGDLGSMPLHFNKSTLTFSGGGVQNSKELENDEVTFYDESELGRME